MDSRKKSLWEIITVYVVDIGVILGLFALGDHFLFAGPILNEAVSSLCHYFIIFLVVVVVVGRLIFGTKFHLMGIEPKKISGTLPFFWISLGFLAFVFLVSILSGYFKPAEFSIYALSILIEMLIGTAFVEEVIFRGILLRQMMKFGHGRGRRIVQIILSALLFAFSHIPIRLVSGNSGTPLSLLGSLVVPFLLGIYLALLYLYTNNLWMCVVAHWTYNCIFSFSFPGSMYIFYTIYILAMLAFLYVVYQRYTAFMRRIAGRD